MKKKCILYSESFYNRGSSKTFRTTMNHFDNFYHILIKRLLSFIGHWPHQSTWEKRLHRVTVSFCSVSIMIPELIKLYEVSDSDFDTIFQCIPALGLHAVNFIKWTNCVFNMDKMKNLLVRMEIDWKSRGKGSGSDILRNYAERGRIITLGYVYYMYVSTILYVFLPLIPLVLDVVNPLNESRPRESLFYVEYFIDQDRYFFPIFLHAFVTTFTSITIVVAFDTIYGTYVQYACAICAELCEQLENGTKNSDDSSENFYVRKDDDYTYHHIVKCIKNHKKAIEFSNILESTYTIYFLFVVGLNILLMSFTGLQTVMKLQDIELAMRYGCFTLGQTVHVLFACWHGQMLIDHSLRINEAIYNSIWYKSSFRTRRLVTLIMMRSVYPCQLSAGNLFFISLETFSTVIKTAMSYFTVLTSLR